MTVWFRDAYFHAEGLITQLLQKIQTLSDAPEVETLHSELSYLAQVSYFFFI